MSEALVNQIRHLREVEGLSDRQIAAQLGISRKRLSRLVKGVVPRRTRAPIIAPYERLIEEWYRQYPSLKAVQVYARLQSYGYPGAYTTVKDYTRSLRRKKKRMYHELEFLPGEEAQVDWMQRTFPFGTAYGFVFLLSYSRYLYLRFYPRQSLEFFLEGHMEAFREIGGVPQGGRYDNLKSVVIRRRPELTFNAQFLDFARHYGFSLHACNPQRANEKGRVERVIRDAQDFLSVTEFRDMADLNLKVTTWRQERNQRVHRTTKHTPVEMLQEERLKSLPAISYQPYRAITGVVSTTGFVTFDTNRYSVPSSSSGRTCQILAYPRHVEIVIDGRKVAAHPRSFGRNEKREHPAHRERLVEITPQFKLQRILQLMRKLDPAIADFLVRAEGEAQDPLQTAYDLFRLLKGNAKETLISAVKEANRLGIYRAAHVRSLLVPASRKDHPVYPQDDTLLDITYESRELDHYDDLI